MTQTPAEQPPGAAPRPADQTAPRHPGYGPTTPTYPATGGQVPHPGYGPNPGSGPNPGYAPGTATAPPPLIPRPTRNTLGLASLIVGAIGPVLGLLFLLIQAALIGSGETQAIGAAGAVNGVLSGLVAAAALVLGLIALSRRGASKTLAAAGIALGAAGLVGVFGAVLYGLVVNLLYAY
ncbi:YML083C domain-containing protein [Herbiconiux daphne]|uniref:DUF4190 domain-containing protein n=1 Tax=Herbiconiux daphne TaxID=2970914 RepID=A0ABT2H2V1_9MICO|nr:hypothetical protein [Herbiconiux daphne]MCS5734242.1 hypothetical protein [Herbiconiux daphne]